MNAADVMTREVVTVRPATLLADAIRLMLGRRVTGLPVVDDSFRLVGLLTEGDLLHRVETGTDSIRFGWLYALVAQGHLAGHYVHTHGRRVQDAMTHDVLTVGETASLDEVIRIMETRHVRRVPVVADGRLIGIVSRSDLLRALGTELDRTRISDRGGDEGIREAVLAEMARHDWATERRIDIVVADGVVTLGGAVFDERVKDALRVIVEGVPGVKEVRNDLSVFDLNAMLMYCA